MTKLNGCAACRMGTTYVEPAARVTYDYPRDIGDGYVAVHQWVYPNDLGEVWA